MASTRAPLRPLVVNSSVAAARIVARVRAGSRPPEGRRRAAGLLTRASIRSQTPCGTRLLQSRRADKALWPAATAMRLFLHRSGHRRDVVLDEEGVEDHQRQRADQ